MGLSASQANLLSLTARLSNLELTAQTISNNKMRLASKSSDASKTYTTALSKQKMTVAMGQNADGSKIYADANVDNLTTYNSDMPNNQRILRSSSGQLIVSDDIADAYDKSGGTNFEVFLNNIGNGYSTFATAGDKLLQDTPVFGDLASSISATRGTITLSTKNVLDSATSTGLETAGKDKKDASDALSGTVDLSAALGKMNDMKTQLTAMYNNSLFNTSQKSAIKTEMDKVDAIITALNAPQYDPDPQPVTPPVDDPPADDPPRHGGRDRDDDTGSTGGTGGTSGTGGVGSAGDVGGTIGTGGSDDNEGGDNGGYGYARPPGGFDPDDPDCPNNW